MIINYYNKITLENCGCYFVSSTPQGPLHPTLCSAALMFPWLLNWWLLSNNCLPTEHRLAAFQAVSPAMRLQAYWPSSHADLVIKRRRGGRTWLWKLKTSSLWPFPPSSQNTSPKVMHIHPLLWVMPALFFPLLKQIKTCFMLNELLSDHSDEGCHCWGAHPAQWPWWWFRCHVEICPELSATARRSHHPYRLRRTAPYLFPYFPEYQLLWHTSHKQNVLWEMQTGSTIHKFS